MSRRDSFVAIGNFLGVLQTLRGKEIARSADTTEETARSWRDGRTHPKANDLARLFVDFPELAAAFMRDCGYPGAALEVREHVALRLQTEMDLERARLGLPARQRRAR